MCASNMLWILKSAGGSDTFVGRFLEHCMWIKSIINSNIFFLITLPFWKSPVTTIWKSFWATGIEFSLELKKDDFC